MQCSRPIFYRLNIYFAITIIEFGLLVIKARMVDLLPFSLMW